MGSEKTKFGIGIIGCGKISQAYFDGAAIFDVTKIIACADLNPAAAEAQAQANACEALSIDALLAHPDIDLIVNLTIPAAHASVSRRILEAGKHVYTEKPLTIELADAKEILTLAKEKDLRIGSAPDTFLGAGLQTCRQIVDAGSIGKVSSGTAFMLSKGVEGWHPNPGFYYLKGGGPVFDMAPYYLSALVHLIGPVHRVSAITSKAFESRIATCKEREGEALPVEVATHASATLEFHSGAVITAIFSFDVQAHGHSRTNPIELYGTEGSLKVPDPNMFGGPVQSFKKITQSGDWQSEPMTHLYTENTRGIGVADMAEAILSNRPHRASGDLAFHVLEVMHAIQIASDSGQRQDIESRPERPVPMPAMTKE